MIGYKKLNQWRIYNPLTKKIHISKNVNFDKGFIYDGSFNKDIKAKIGELWSFKDNKKLALEEKEWELEILANNNNHPKLRKFWSFEDNKQ